MKMTDRIELNEELRLEYDELLLLILEPNK